MQSSAANKRKELNIPKELLDLNENSSADVSSTDEDTETSSDQSDVNENSNHTYADNIDQKMGNTSHDITTSRPQRERRLPAKFLDYVSDLCNYCTDIEPRSITEARNSEDAVEWEKAAVEEYKSLVKNDTWEVVNLPQGRKAVGCKWVFRRKRTADGGIDRYKARLVAQGFSQLEGVDFEETYAPVSKISTIRTLIAYAVNKSMYIHQMDVTAAYLHGKLDETIFMKQPPGFEISGQENKVLKLKKSIYGLKQSGRNWYKCLTEELYLKLNLKRLHSDYGVFVNTEGPKVVMVIYVDDILIIAKQVEHMKALKSHLNQRFKMKDLGETKYFLGISIRYNMQKGIATLSQESFCKEILTKFNMDKSKQVSTPMETVKFINNRVSEEPPVNKQEYLKAIGVLQYLSQATRPDIAFSVNYLSRYSSNPSAVHWQAVKRIFRYLQGTADLCMKITKKNGPIKIEGYVDADFAGDDVGRKSTSGFVFMLNGSCVSFSSKKQSNVALSTTESELCAASFAAREAVWLNRLLQEIGEEVDCIKLYVDNNSVLQLVANPVFHARTKHIDVLHFFIREKVEEGLLMVERVDSSMNCADALTKPTSKLVLKKHMDALSLGKENCE